MAAVLRQGLVALGLAWYLLVPPTSRPDADPDLRRWTHRHSYDTAAACQQAILDNVEIIKNEVVKLEAQRQKGVEAVEAWLYRMNAARCIAATDPRLSPKGDRK